ncbi:hypothetical protein MYP_169 [Sporocytophaga myxococcoides]|uniref:Uncharacterized protein n=1 Tax=Sporocytophaga myxococcoides TaxID=153721 RepID=A0A098L9U7_9BACT|nr:hypothetical protein [Sporocytophaga myxococcoides]GAL82943.1 hypothetical protein MYP_169 [Sporocytophaga myxococcoides]
MKTESLKLRARIKFLICLFIAGLILSGLTAFPLETELFFIRNAAQQLLEPDNPLYLWVDKVYIGLHDTNIHYPFLAYGTDWLAFAHIVIAIIFIGPLKDPVKNIWVIHFGMFACIAVFPLAFIAGEIRDIPFYWRVIDCMFGAIGVIPLMYCDKYIKRIIRIENLKIYQTI